MLLKRLAELSNIDQSELEEKLQIKPSSKKYVTRKAPPKQLATPYRRLIMMLLHNPNYINRLNRNWFSEEKENSKEITALKSLIELFDKNPHLINSELPTSTIFAYLQDSAHRTLLENIESETLKWDDAIDLEAEFLGTLEKLQQAQRKKRITELYSKPLSMLTNDEKRELQQLAMR